MIFCEKCFRDKEIKAAIEMIEYRGDCPICGSKNVWIYDSAIGEDISSVEEMLASVF